MDFSAIEHDFLHVKDYFSNFKFTYKERKSKLDFLSNVNSDISQDTSSLITSSKEQLVEVKNVYKTIDEEIKNLSKSIYEIKEENKLKSDILKSLSDEEAMLIEEYEKLVALNESTLVQGRLNEELEAVEKEISDAFEEMESIKSQIDPSLTLSRKEEEKLLRQERNDLAAKQKRLTLINTENYIEDIYYWNRQYLDILEKVFGSVSVSGTFQKSILKLAKKDVILEITIENQAMTDSFISKHLDQDNASEFEQIKKRCIESNDPSMIIAFFLKI